MKKRSSLLGQTEITEKPQHKQSIQRPLKHTYVTNIGIDSFDSNREGLYMEDSVDNEGMCKPTEVNQQLLY